MVGRGLRHPTRNSLNTFALKRRRRFRNTECGRIEFLICAFGVNWRKIALWRGGQSQTIISHLVACRSRKFDMPDCFAAVAADLTLTQARLLRLTSSYRSLDRRILRALTCRVPGKMRDARRPVYSSTDIAASSCNGRHRPENTQPELGASQVL